MYVNGPAGSEIYRIKYATVADYQWNSETYNPEFSLWKALTTAYGPAGAQDILLFNEAYYGLYEMCMRMEREEGSIEGYVRQGGAWLERLDESLSKLMRQLPAGHALVKELTAHRNRQKSRFDGLVGANPARP
jgi:hypothetical protein